MPPLSHGHDTNGLIHHPWLNHDQRLKGNLHKQANAERNDRLDVYPKLASWRETRLTRRLRVILKIANNREIEIPCQNSNPLRYTFGDAFRLAFALLYQNHHLSADHGLTMDGE
ncbi:hypothetical protein AVEN_243915-1 [Araneus ventricosus]|uniref:Uncharacterized protein n=1 Tax=Araneus ventricosus TaxID=182803 RepID=A0A4Y1ZTP6_ARAVE|nr:hypothetical protein AVEN_243915-1 [Araneus ventricosus]